MQRIDVLDFVSTHSRPKAAANERDSRLRGVSVSTHSRPKAAADITRMFALGTDVSTHSRPKAAAQSRSKHHSLPDVSTHSRPKAAASEGRKDHDEEKRFNSQPPEGGCDKVFTLNFPFSVSTHSRPKAAASPAAARPSSHLFQLTAARRRLRRR